MERYPLLPPSWRLRIHGILLLPALIAALVALALQVTGVYTITDGVIFDSLATRSTAEAPKVTIVERSAETDVAALAQASFDLGANRVAFLSDPEGDFSGLATELREDVILGESIDPRLISADPGLMQAFEPNPGSVRRLPRLESEPQYGIHRSLTSWIGETSDRIGTFETLVMDTPPSEKSYYVPMPRSLSFAVLSPGQLFGGDLAKGDLEGLTVLVAIPSELESDLLTTPLDPNSQSVSQAQFSAYAMQSLTDGEATQKIGMLGTLIAIALVALLAGSATILMRRRLFALAVAGILCLLIGLAGWFALEIFARILPFGGMLSAVIFSTLGTIFLQERRKDLRLENALIDAIGQSVSHTAFRNRDNLPTLLKETAVTAGIERMLLLSPEEPFAANPPAKYQAEIADLSASAHESLLGLTKELPGHASLAVEDLLPSWPGQVRLRAIGAENEPLYWLYTFGDQPDADSGEFIASSLAQSFLAMQKSHASLSAQQRGLRVIDPVDFRVVNAIDLIARHGRQLRKATDQLSASVMMFDVVGFPIHANPQMIDLLEASGLNPQTSLLPEIIETLTDLSKGQSEALLRDILRQGGEASAAISGLPGINAILHVSSPDPAISARESVVLLEAFDTSELARLSDLRLAVSDFVDVQMRNDLETITLGAALARKAGGNEERRIRMIDKIVQAAQTATTRLNEMNRLARGVPTSQEFAAHPIQLKPVIEKVPSRLLDFADGYAVEIELSLPEVSGYSVGDPFVLSKMLVALLRLVIADSPPDSSVNVTLTEQETVATIVISGGFGMAYERFQKALDAPPRKEIPEFQTVKECLLAMSSWGADFAYESETGKGYEFTLTLRRIV